MSDRNNIYKSIENYVSKGGISRDETHVDFDINRESIVTWCLDEDPLPTHTTSVYVRRINDVRQITRLKKKNKELTKQRDMFEADLMAELRCRNALQMEVGMLKKKIENLMAPTNAKPNCK